MAGIRPEIREARDARGELGLGLTGPLDDILRTVEEDAGVPVLIAALPQGFAGLLRIREGRPMIGINGMQAAVRQRFTLAHEFGHYRLGHGTVLDRDSDINGSDPREVQANYFAGEFLAPRDAVSTWLETQGDPAIDLEVVVRFACRFGLSAKAARVRFEIARLVNRRQATELDALIDANEHSSLRSRLGLRQMADSLARIRELPRLPHQMEGRATRILASGLIDIAELAERTGYGEDRLRELLRSSGDDANPENQL